jgi:hypothetical protein
VRENKYAFGGQEGREERPAAKAMVGAVVADYGPALSPTKYSSHVEWVPGKVKQNKYPFGDKEGHFQRSKKHGFAPAGR